MNMERMRRRNFFALLGVWPLSLVARFYNNKPRPCPPTVEIVFNFQFALTPGDEIVSSKWFGVPPDVAVCDEKVETDRTTIYLALGSKASLGVQLPTSGDLVLTNSIQTRRGELHIRSVRELAQVRREFTLLAGDTFLATVYRPAATAA